MHREARQFWQLVLHDPDWLEEFILYDPEWTGTCIACDEAAQDDTSVDRLYAMFLFMLQLKEFASSRWLTQVPVCMRLVGLFSMGLPHLVNLARSSHTTSDWYLHGWSFLNDSVRTVARRGICLS